MKNSIKFPVFDLSKPMNIPGLVPTNISAFNMKTNWLPYQIDAIKDKANQFIPEPVSDNDIVILEKFYEEYNVAFEWIGYLWYYWYSEIMKCEYWRELQLSVVACPGNIRIQILTIWCNKIGLQVIKHINFHHIP